MKNKKNRQNSLTPPQNKDLLVIKEKFELTEKQKEIIQTGISKTCRCILIDGLWGTSKSYLATLISLKLLNEKKINQILFIRNPVESSTTGRVGTCPGTAEEKMSPFNEIFFSKLEELLSKCDIEKLKNENKINCIPLGFCRGLSWNSKAIIVDESSSMSWDDLLLLLSRCGEHTRIFFIGDSINQNDIGSKSGFKKIFDLLSDQESKDNGVYTYELKSELDILRSGFVRFIMKKAGKIGSRA